MAEKTDLISHLIKTYFLIYLSSQKADHKCLWPSGSMLPMCSSDSYINKSVINATHDVIAMLTITILMFLIIIVITE